MFTSLPIHESSRGVALQTHCRSFALGYVFETYDACRVFVLGVNTSQTVARFAPFTQTNYFKVGDPAMNGFLKSFNHLFMTTQAALISDVTGCWNGGDHRPLSESPFMNTASTG